MAYTTDPELTFLDVETVRYELERFGVRYAMSRELLARLRIEAAHSYVADEVAFKIVGVVPMWRSQRLLEVPANWWQHFKQRWFPAWALKKWPVLTVTHDAAVILPYVPVVNPDYHQQEFAVWRQRRT